MIGNSIRSAAWGNKSSTVHTGVLCLSVHHCSKMGGGFPDCHDSWVEIVCVCVDCIDKGWGLGKLQVFPWGKKSKARGTELLPGMR